MITITIKIDEPAIQEKVIDEKIERICEKVFLGYDVVYSGFEIYTDTELLINDDC